MRLFPCPERAMRLAATGIGCAMILGSALGARAQAPIPSGKFPTGLKAGKIKEGLSIVERGPNHRVFENWSANGVRTRYVELASGLHVKDGKGDWKEADLKIALDVNGAIAEGGTVKVKFTADINSRGGISLETPSGDRFRSHVTGLAYFDRSSGQSVMLAETKSSIGRIIENTVVYEDAFDDIEADVRYTNARGFFEQDVILREQPPSPEQFGLNAETTDLLVMTEFVESPQPKSALRLPPASSPTSTNAVGKALDQRAEQAKVSIPDDVLEFKDSIIGSGKAFTESDSGSAVRVHKEFKKLDGRQFLIESVPLKAAGEDMKSLKKSRHASVGRINKALYAGLRAPAAKPESRSIRAMQYAGLSPRRAGYVVDYQQLTSSATDFTFEAGMTYLVTGLFSASGTTVIEPAAVIKNTGTNSASIRILGGLECRTTAERPAVFTSFNDNTIGDTISGSSGTPSSYTGPALKLDYASGCTPATLSNIRISYAAIGVELNGSNATSGSSYIKHGQFVNCTVGVSMSSTYALRVQNALFSGVVTVFSASGHTIGGEHLTVNGSTNLQSGSNTIGLTNSLLVAVTNTGSYSGAGNQTASSASAVFETVGAGAHYLPTGSAYRNTGVTGIDWKLRNDLGERTTFSPQMLQSPISVDTTLRRRLIRDNDSPDLGYHYAAVDYASPQAFVTNGAKLTISEGVTIAGYGQYGALHVWDGTISLEGSPTRRINILPYTYLQENSSVWGSYDRSYNFAILNYHIYDPYGPRPSISAKFTDFGPFSFHTTYADGGDWSVTKVDYRDCAFYATAPAIVYAWNGLFSIKNCLFEGGTVWMQWGVGTTEIRNCLFNRTAFNVVDIWQIATIQDNVFVRSPVSAAEETPVNTLILTHGYNAYVDMPYSTNRIYPTQTTDKVLASADFVPGLMGRYYLSLLSPLRTNGSQTAAAAGLYHHTATIDQRKKTNSPVDIGLHYPALVADSSWSDDAVNVWSNVDGDNDGWVWNNTSVLPASGTNTHYAAGTHSASWMHQHYHYDNSQGIALSATNSIYAYIWLNPTNSPSTVMIQVYGGSPIDWPHRAYWGQDDTPFTGWGSRTYMGPLPRKAGWNRLEFNAEDVGLGGLNAHGMAFTLKWGRAWWDRVGVLSFSANSSLVDTDGDGVPDITEDKNGNGSSDSGETDWQAFNSPLGNGNGSSLSIFTPLR